MANMTEDEREFLAYDELLRRAANRTFEADESELYNSSGGSTPSVVETSYPYREAILQMQTRELLQGLLGNLTDQGQRRSLELIINMLPSKEELSRRTNLDILAMGYAHRLISTIFSTVLRWNPQDDRRYAVRNTNDGIRTRNYVLRNLRRLARTPVTPNNIEDLSNQINRLEQRYLFRTLSAAERRRHWTEP